MSTLDSKIMDFARIILAASQKQVLKKVVFSKHKDKTIQKTVLTLKNISGRICLQAESFHTDNKAKHENIELSDKLFDRYCDIMATIHSEIPAKIEKIAQKYGAY